MKDVYEKNPQMGDPASLAPQITQTAQNMERLRGDLNKYEVSVLTLSVNLYPLHKDFLSTLTSWFVVVLACRSGRPGRLDTILHSLSEQ